MSAFKPFLEKALSGAPLTADEAEAAFGLIMDGVLHDAQIGGFLVALRMRGETVDEIAAAAKVMRAKANAISAPADAVDIVGTGGDGVGTWNISTAAALVLAGCGLRVAKHGNRALSSKSGAADALSALGVNLDAPFERIERAIAEAGIGFLMAPRHHPAIKSVMPARIAMGVRTVFNVLGPLTNPAGVDRICIGVYDPAWLEPLAHTLHALGTRRAWVLHGAGGLDEASTLGPTEVAALADGAVTRMTITPEMIGAPIARLDALKGGDAAQNAAKIRALLDGEAGAYRDIVLLNAAAALCAYGEAEDLAAAAARAAKAIDTGAARGALDALAKITGAA